MPGDFIIRDVMINPIVSDRVMPGRSRGFGAAVNIAVVSGRAGSRSRRTGIVHRYIFCYRLFGAGAVLFVGAQNRFDDLQFVVQIIIDAS